MQEFESIQLDPLEGYVTKIDFEIEKEVEKLKRSTIKQLTFYNKKEVVFTLEEKEKLQVLVLYWNVISTY